MLSGKYRLHALLLQRPEGPPTDRIDDVVLNERIQQIECTHTSREMSSTEEAAMRLRSCGVISSLRKVSR